MADWGKANSDDLGNGWRTLKDEEWKYLFNQKDYKNPIRDGKYKCNVTVCGKEHCVVVAPDDWDVTAYPLQPEYGPESTPMTWNEAQDAGLICLPAAGWRNNVNPANWNVGSYGRYWSSSRYTIGSTPFTSACSLQFSPSGIYSSSNPSNRRCVGLSVRLVKDAN